ncbi:MAG: tetratricopeptide repeat protein [Chitinophagales bacterium]|nr:tetratricopeptide repeat protein [Chitinophagales bacterium]MDW8427852.1 tetratricopeptide repeat protein [Chitinophagales bacterium]
MRALTVSLLFLFIALAALIYGIYGCKKKETSTGSVALQRTATDTTEFVGDVTCRRCHEQAYQLWRTSHHYRAMLPANDSSVLAPFAGETYVADGISSRFFRNDSLFLIHTEGPDGKNRTYPVAFTFGYHPLQQYLIAFPKGRLQVTRQSWDVERKKWYHQYAGQRIDTADWLHWTRGAQTWNLMCAECHSTNLKTNYSLNTDSFATTWSVINVSCEACHGPGKKHVAYVTSSAYASGQRIPGAYLVLGGKTSAEAQVTVCAPCHSRRLSLLQQPFEKLSLLDHYVPEIIRTPFYHADGQVNEEVYEYGSYLQSRMYYHKVRCTDCHEPHSGRLRLQGNALCLQCHKKELNEFTHTFHEAGSPGSQCISCHMPTKTFMGIDVRHDHSFRVPRPDQTVRYGVPNACNQCHTNRSAQWAADRIRQWYGPQRSYHFSDDLIPGSRGNVARLHKLCMPDTNVPPIVHATALYYMQFHYHRENVKYLTSALSHAEPLIRYHALRSLAFYPSDQWYKAALPLLRDSIRAVRIAAADLLLEHADTLPPHLLADYQKARRELEAFIMLQAPFPTGRQMMGDLLARQHRYQEAEAQYLAALRMDSLLIPARLNLVTLYNILQRNKEALHHLKVSYAIDPSNERVNYFLALLYVELMDFAKAEEHFERASRVSANPRVFYNYGLFLEQQQKFSKAEQMYRRGLALAPDNVDLNYVMALFYYKQKRNKEALPYALKLLELMPQNSAYRELVQQLQVP